MADSAPFFGEPETRNLVHRLFERSSDTVRAWFVGCGTGEELYAFAIILFDEAYHASRQPGIRIIVSDSNRASLAAAREGFCSKDIEKHVTPERAVA